MKKIEFFSISNDIVETISRSGNKTVYKLKNGHYFKSFLPEYLGLLKSVGYDIESHILSAKPIPKIPEIIIPSSAVYLNNSTFLGYLTPPAKGVSFLEYEKSLTLEQKKDLCNYSILHSNIEKVVKKASGIVFPDLCTTDNIFVDNNLRAQFIDYDGLQIGKFTPTSISTSLGEQSEYMKPKYWKNSQFTKELDKKSLIVLYFLTAFNIDLTKVGMINPYTGKEITLDEVFRLINLDENDDICHKTWKLFNSNESNEYLGNAVFDIADKYDLNIFGSNADGMHMKYLTRKK